MRSSPFERFDSARHWLESGRPDRAESALRRTFPPSLHAEALFLRAEALRAQGFFKRAQISYREALGALGRDERDLIANAWLGLARCARSLGEIPDARRAIARACRASRGEGKQTLALENALIDRAAGLYRQSIQSLTPLLRQARRRRDWSAVGFLLWAIGGARRFSGDLAASHRDFKESLAAFRRAEDREGQAYALFGLGGIARIRGLFKEARAAYATAGQALGSGPDIFGRAYAHCGLANVLRQLGLWKEAERYYRRSYALYAHLDDRVDLAYVDWGLGQVYLRRGELPAAEKHFRAALKSFAASKEARGEVLSLQSLAQILHARGRTQEGERSFDAAIRRARRAGLHAHLEIFT